MHIKALEMLTERDVHAAIRACMENSSSARLAVAFWGANSRKNLELTKANDLQVVCNLRMGGTNPHEIQSMIDEGVDVLQCDDLHAKVYLFDHAVIVGSSNASTNGLGIQDGEAAGWRELNFLSTDLETIKEVQRWYGELPTRSISPSDIERAAAIWKLRRQVPIPLTSTSLLDSLRQSPTTFDDKNVFLVIWSKDMDQDGYDALKDAQVRFGIEVAAFQGWPKLPKEGHLICFERLPRGKFRRDSSFWQRRLVPADIQFNGDDSLQLLWPVETILGMAMPKHDEAEWKTICQKIVDSDLWDGEDGTAFIDLSDLARTSHVFSSSSGSTPQTAGKNRIHFICKDRLGISTKDAKSGTYTSEAWLLTPRQVAALSGGEVLFHQSKAVPSYFGGTIIDAKPIDADEPPEHGRIRWQLTLQSRIDCKGLSWDRSGQTHGMAWTSGVVRANA